MATAPAANITDTMETNSEVVLQERKTTNEFKIIEIQESIQNRRVQVQLELGPFVEETNVEGVVTGVRASGRRGITVWENEAYDEVRDTWRNADLIAEVVSKLG